MFIYDDDVLHYIICRYAVVHDAHYHPPLRFAFLATAVVPGWIAPKDNKQGAVCRLSFRELFPNACSSGPEPEVWLSWRSKEYHQPPLSESIPRISMANPLPLLVSCYRSAPPAAHC